MNNIKKYNAEKQLLKILKETYNGIQIVNPISDIEESLSKEFSALNIEKIRQVLTTPDFTGLVNQEQFLQGTYISSDDIEKNHEGLMLFNDNIYFFKNSTAIKTGDPRILDTMILQAKNLSGEKFSIHAHTIEFLSLELEGITDTNLKVNLSMSGHPIIKNYFENKYNSLLDKILTDYKK